MKNIPSLLVFLVILLLLETGCSNWSTSRENVSEPYVTTMAFVMKNSSDTTLCEGAPGDTMELHAYFAGAAITNIDWKVSYNVYKDPYGNDTVMEIQELPDSFIIVPDDNEFSANTEVHAIKIPIPSNIMETSPSVDDEFLKEFGVDKEEMIFLIEQIAAMDSVDVQNDSVLSDFLKSVEEELFQIMQMFTVPVRVFANIDGLYNVRSDFMVRYNRFFDAYKKIFVNHNPVINYMLIHKFKKNPYPDFNAEDFTLDDTTYVLYMNNFADTSDIPAKNFVFSDSVIIDSGYVYYVSVDSGYVSGVLQKDSTTSMLPDKDGKPGIVSLETFFTHWYYEMNIEEKKLVPDHNNHMIINSGGNFMDALYPPLDTRITEATLWVNLYDYFLGERLRISGNNLKEAKIYFKYTDRYKKHVAKN